MSYGNGGQGVIGIGQGLGGMTPPSYPTAPPATRETVQNALDRQQQAIGVLHAMISELETRLTAALDPQPPADVNAKQLAAPTATSVLHRVSDSIAGIEGATRRIGELTQRVNL
jgi:hypothetical protein